MSKVTLHKKREVRTHASLWHTSRCLMERGQAQEEASQHQFMASLVFTAFTLEAYLNWLGERLFSRWGYLDRLRPTEKLDLISDQLKVSVDYGKRPWQTIDQLFKFRNKIAHGKSVLLETKTTEPLSGYLDNFSNIARTDWEKYSTGRNAQRAREDVGQILEVLHAAANITDGLSPFSAGIQLNSATYNAS